MFSVELTIRALRREILAALRADAPLPGGVELVADRVSITLALETGAAPETAGAGGSLVVARETGPGLHHLNIEFKLQWTPATADRAASLAADAGPMSRSPVILGTGESPYFAGLCEIFGEPGFDSSARATVFRETLQELNESESHAVLASLGSALVTEAPPAVGLARHLVLRLAGSGPAGPKRGPDLLRQLGEQAPVAELIRLAAERWRTQSEWAAAAARSPVAT